MTVMEQRNDPWSINQSGRKLYRVTTGLVIGSLLSPASVLMLELVPRGSTRLHSVACPLSTDMHAVDACVVLATISYVGLRVYDVTRQHARGNSYTSS